MATPTTILSWNTGKKKTTLIQNSIKELVDEHNFDIIVLQECLGSYVNALLDTRYDELNFGLSGIDKRVRIFLKKEMFLKYDTDAAFNSKAVFAKLERAGSKDTFNLIAVHLYSKAGNSEREQLWKNLPFVGKIEDWEGRLGSNKRTVLIGDFNYNPYEKDMLDSQVFNSLDNRSLITIFNKFNPQKEQVTKEYWSEILTKTNTIEFLKPLITRTNESIIQDDLSDHLPIKITINL